MSAPGIKSITTDSFGDGTVEISHNKTGFYWDLKQFSIGLPVTPSDNTIAVHSVVCSAQIVFNGQPCTSVTTGKTPLTASGDPSMKIGDHDVLTVVISQAPPSTTLIVTYYYDEIPGSI